MAVLPEDFEEAVVLENLLRAQAVMVIISVQVVVLDEVRVVLIMDEEYPVADIRSEGEEEE